MIANHFKRSGFILLLLTAMLPLSVRAQDSDDSEIELDYTATSLAQQILANPKNSEALELALQMAQITIRQPNGSHSGVVGQGLYMDSWNIAAMNAALTKGISLSLNNYLLMWQLSADSVHGPIPENAILDSRLRQKFLGDMIENANLPEDDSSGLRFMTHLITALGREASTNPYDLLGAKVADSAQLNIVQMYVLTHRISAELWARAQKYKPLTPLNFNLKNNIFANSTVASTAATSSPPPCTMTDTEALIMDGVAAGSGAAVGGLQFVKGFVDHLEDLKFITDVGAEKFNNMNLAANVSLNFLKFGLTMAAFTATMTADPQPLIRNKNTTPGANSTLTAQFSLDTSSIQMANCIRPALNLVGLDFNVPQGGPLAGSLVEWAIQARQGADNDVLQTIGDPLHQVTDSEGRSQFTVRGKPRKKNLEGLKLLQVDRQVPIIATANLKNKNNTQDAIDLFAGLSGISALWSLPLELLNRMPLLFNAVIKLKVTDWKELEGDHFKIVGTYRGEDILNDGWKSRMSSIQDQFTADIEVKVATSGGSSGMLLSFNDESASFNDDFPGEFFAGEGCRSTQSPIGRYEPFNYDFDSGKIAVAYYPGTPAQPRPSAKVMFNFSGRSHSRGWLYRTEFPNCQLDNSEESDSENQLQSLTFSSLQLQKVGDFITIDETNRGYGWKYVITYVE